MKTIRDICVKNKTILVRVDYNVPIKNGKVVNNLRIKASLPTLKYLRDHEAKKIILISHLGRPDGQDPSLSLKPIADTLKKLIPDVSFIDDVSGPDVESAIKNLKTGGILLLENLRFYPGEEQNSDDFIREIINSTGADLFVQDGFAVIHRAHASTDTIKNHLPVYAGLLLEKEVESLDKCLKNPARPLIFIIGGAKVADKKPLIDKFTKIADQILVGGKISADGYKSDNKKIIVANDFDEDSAGNKLDVGPVSTAEFAKIIEPAKTIIWNGLLGYAEDPAYATSSTIIADLLGEKADTTTIICGGDTTAFVENLMATNKQLHYSLISTGGGATLEYLLGHSLPGLKAIKS